jgi:hypothetical protein
MKTKKIPYLCPVCQGKPLPTETKEDYVELKAGDVLQWGDEYLTTTEAIRNDEGEWYKTGRVGVAVREKDHCYRRKTVTVKPTTCKACDGKGIVWGEEKDDSIPFTVAPTAPATPDYPLGPYTYPTWPYVQQIAWYQNTCSTDCPNFGF